MAICVAMTFVLLQTAGLSAYGGILGANTPNLWRQYVNPPVPSQALTAGDRAVWLAMARKAVADAHDAGLRFVRASVTGYFPVNFGDGRDDLRLWQTDPAAYWADLDRMFDDLDRVGVRLVPSFLWQMSQFAVLGGNTLHEFVTSPDSRGRQLFARYLREFIARYKKRNTILFYELTNEMNLGADLDLHGHCAKGRPPPCVWDHFSTAEMNRFAADEVARIHRLDPSRKVDSGYSIPRRGAWHLMQRPGFLPGGPGFSPDTPAEFRQVLLLVNRPFDIISVHIYPGAENNRFGRPPGEEYKLVGDAEAAARAAGKPLFVGEFGDKGATPSMTNMLRELAQNRVAYAAIWAWEFYQTSTYQTHNTAPSRTSIEPGYDDDVIDLLKNTERMLGAPPPPARPNAPPRVVLTWPLPCAIVNRPVKLYAIASAGAHAVKSVEFLVDGRTIAMKTSYPYTVRFNPEGLGRREVKIAARAVGPSGIVSNFVSPVRLNGDRSACTVPEGEER
jgi:hypothetical protein